MKNLKHVKLFEAWFTDDGKLDKKENFTKIKIDKVIEDLEKISKKISTKVYVKRGKDFELDLPGSPSFAVSDGMFIIIISNDPSKYDEYNEEFKEVKMDDVIKILKDSMRSEFEKDAELREEYAGYITGVYRLK